MKLRMRAAALFGLLLSLATLAAQPALLPIGVIQGAGDTSPYLNRFVNFTGVVVGRYEDQNTRGDVYYTLFVQDLPETADGDPATSDGIAVFLGREPRPDIALGQRVTVGGKVTEYYGLTEIDDEGLFVTPGELAALPVPVAINPPADMAEMALYFEALEGMRVAYNGAVIVAGPTHSGCGFAVIGERQAANLPAARRAPGDPVGQVVPVLYPSDRACDDIPQVKTGDRIMGMAGALTYNFDQFKIVIDSAEQLTVEPATLPSAPVIPTLEPHQAAIVSLNAEDMFDTVRDTAEQGEPVPTDEDVAARRAKLVQAIGENLRCPALIALQEVENEILLADISADLSVACGFAYQNSHRDSPDARGIDNALLSDPGRVTVEEVLLRQACSAVPADVVDRSVACAPGEEPLFGRPPLQVAARIDGQPYTIFVNHFKSKRGGETETGLERVYQAIYLNELSAELLAADATARIIALGDFNDTELSPALALLADPAQGGHLVNALAAVPPEERYTYNFGGVVELIDTILVSPAVAVEIGAVTVLHSNTDFPIAWREDISPERRSYRVSDHDIPVVILGHPLPTPTPTIEPATPAVRPSPEEDIANPQPVAAVEKASPTPALNSPTAAPTAATAPPAVIDLAQPGGGASRMAWPWLLLGGAFVVLLAAWLASSRR